MKIVSAEFVKSAFNKQQWVSDGRPEIAFLGRSNVGKSSLLNSLLGRKGLARTSNTPGRTQSINYFLINDSFYFVDLPGYGFARVSKAKRADWGEMARDYLDECRSLVLSIHLVDSRHEPTSLDIQLNEWLVQKGLSFIVVATKADKLSGNQLPKQLKVIRSTLSGSDVIAYSSISKKGRDDVWNEIAKVV